IVERASAKALYDRLVPADLAAFLAAEAANAAKYHLVLAADVFVYVSDLAPVVVATACVLPPDGLFAFTVETHPGEGVKLQPTLRYAHGAAYIRAALADAGLTALRLSETSVRSEKGEPVPGLVVVASTVSELPARSGA